jgi:phosphotransferase system HPr-like phosphotransfer protein
MNRPGSGVSLARARTLATLAVILVSSAPAIGQEAQPSAERIKAAAEEFDRGRRAYLARDYEQAAGHFENAFRDAPSKETLRLAIRARRDAKQHARAATLAAVAQDRFAADPQTAQLAKEVLAESARDLAELAIECAAPCTIAADGRVVSQADGVRHRIFVEPGAHDLGVSFQQGASTTRHLEAKKGTSTPLAFEPPPAPKPPPEAPKPPPETAPPVATKPLGPAVFFVAGGLTVALGAATVVSGIATESDPGPDAVRRECAGKGESCALYQEGQDAETRTNVLLGVAIGAAVVTGVIGLFFTQWSTPGRHGLRLGPGGIHGRF